MSTALLPVPILKQIVSTDIVSPISLDGSRAPTFVIDLTHQAVPGDTVVRVFYHSSVLQGEQTDRGVYAGGTTYAKGDFVSWHEAEWISLQNSNTGHTPDLSPMYWNLVSNRAPLDDSGQLPLNTSIRITRGLEPGVYYDLYIKYESPAGAFGPNLALMRQLLEGQMSVPLDPTGFGGLLNKIGDIKLSWNAPIGQHNIKYYEIREGSTFSGGVLVAQINGTNLTIHAPTIAAHQYWIATVDTSGNYSIHPITVTVTVPSANQFNTYAVVGHSGAGTCTSMGTKRGDKAQFIFGSLTAGGVLVAFKVGIDFEDTISVNDQIQQLSASNLTTYTLIVVTTDVSASGTITLAAILNDEHFYGGKMMANLLLGSILNDEAFYGGTIV